VIKNEFTPKLLEFNSSSSLNKDKNRNENNNFISFIKCGDDHSMMINKNEELFIMGNCYYKSNKAESIVYIPTLILFPNNVNVWYV